MKKRPELRIVKRTYGTRDITEACQAAFEPYFRDEEGTELNLRVGKETFGTKNIDEAFKEALEPYFRDEEETPNRSKPSKEAIKSIIMHMASTSLPRILAEKEREKQRSTNENKDDEMNDTLSKE